MTLQAECASVVGVLERVGVRLREDGAQEGDEELSSLLAMLRSPLFTQLLTIQDSISQLKEYEEQRPVGPNDFEIDRNTGQLTLNEHEELTSVQVAEGYTLPGKQNLSSFESQPVVAGTQLHAAATIETQHSVEVGAAVGERPASRPSSESLDRALRNAAWGREMHRIELFKPEKSSLGFSVMGLRSDMRGELGIFVQEVQPGGIAHTDGRLAVQDQILAINSHVLDASISHQQAIRILQLTCGKVHLVVARDAADSPSPSPTGLLKESKTSDSSTPVSPSSPGSADEAESGSAAEAEGGEEEGEAEGEEEEAAEEDGEQEPASSELAAAAAGATEGGGRTASAHSDSNSDMVLSTEWSQLEVIELVNDGTGLGFGIIGGKSTGVVVKTILPGGVADRDGRLRSGDHILQIGDVNVRGLGSEQVASVLRQSGAQVRLIVARAVHDSGGGGLTDEPHAPLVPTHLLDEHLHELNQALLALDSHIEALTPEQYMHQYKQMTGEFPLGMEDPILNGGDHGDGDINMMTTSGEPEVEYFSVDLAKFSHGLGITIAGYIREQGTDDLSGIFVRSVAEGSAAALDGRVQVNDQIIEVDGQSLGGFSNHQAVDVLRQTGMVVHLKLARYLHGRKYQQIQQYASQLLEESESVSREEAVPWLQDQQQQGAGKGEPNLIELEEITPRLDDYTGELAPEVEEAVRSQWQQLVGDAFTVVVAQLSKLSPTGGLGISLEGTVDVENGQEVRPHHYIRSVLAEGPVGINGRLTSGDELLEVNCKRLLGLNHMEVVKILKELPQFVRIVCARKVASSPTHSASASPPPVALGSDSAASPPHSLPGSPSFHATVTATSPTGAGSYGEDDSERASPDLLGGRFATPPIGYGGSLAGSGDEMDVGLASDRLVKAKSEQVLGSEDAGALEAGRGRWRSAEPISQLGMWNSEPLVIELVKGERGLGFSILDYQDPINPDESVIVIRSLVPGGVAQLDGRLVPGDRLVFVNSVHLEHATLDQAVAALKGAQPGVVRVGVAKPMPLPEIGESSTDPAETAQQLLDAEELMSFTHTADIPPSSLPLRIPSDTPPSNAPPTPPVSHSASPASNTHTAPIKADFSSSLGSSPVGITAALPYKKPGSQTTPFAKTAPKPLTTEPSPSAPTVKPPASKPAPESSGGLASLMLSELSLATLDFDAPPAPTSAPAQASAKQPDRTQKASPSRKPHPPHPPKRQSSISDKTRPAKDPVEPEQPVAATGMAGNTNTAPVSPPLIHEPAITKPVLSPKPPPDVLTGTQMISLQRPVAAASAGVSAQTASPDRSTSLSTFKPALPPKLTSPRPVLPLTSTSLQGVGQKPNLPPKPGLGLASTTEDKPHDAYASSSSSPLESPRLALNVQNSPSTHSATSHLLRGRDDAPVTSAHNMAAAHTSDLNPRVSSASAEVTSPPVPSQSATGADSNTSPLTAVQLEKTIKIRKAGQELGLTVDGCERPGGGCPVRAVRGAVAGRVRTGDYIVSVNNENLRASSAAQARAVLRRADLVATDVSPSSEKSVTYVLADDAKAYAMRSGTRTGQPPPASQLSPKPSLQLPGTGGLGTPVNSSQPLSSNGASIQHSSYQPASPALGSTPGAGEADGKPRGVSPLTAASSWGPPRRVYIERRDNESLGISIVGGRVDLFNVSAETQRSISGIFIKHVLDNSPAGRQGSLQTGDRILEVDGVDLREATHDKAVGAIKAARSPVTFLIQSLVAEDWDEELEDANCDLPAQQTELPLPVDGHDEFGNSWGAKKLSS